MNAFRLKKKFYETRRFFFAVAATAAVVFNASFESVGFDFEASDAIFADDEPSTANAGDNDNDDGEENADEDNDCDCSTCRERMRHKEELNRYEISVKLHFSKKKSINVLTSFKKLVKSLL